MHTGERATDGHGPALPAPRPQPRGGGRGGGHPDTRAGPRTGKRFRGLAWCAGLLLVTVSVPLTARAMDADGPTPVPQLLAFLPWFLVPGWLALAFAVLTRRTLLGLWALAVLAGTAWFLPPYGADGTAGAAGAAGAAEAADGAAQARFRILTANLRFGDATEALVETVRRERPQLVAVQECDSRCASALQRTALRELYPHRVIVSGGAAEGSALLSSYPLREDGSVPGRLSMPGAVVHVEGRPVHVQLAHPMPPVPDSVAAWRRELAGLRAYAAARDGKPVIVAGDFNASQDHAAFRALLDTGLRDAARLTGRSRTPTWPVPAAPPLGAQIDHILLSEPLAAVRSDFLDLPDTDHRALLADIKLF